MFESAQSAQLPSPFKMHASGVLWRVPHDFDVVVLGAGITGTAAALAAAAAGARVAVITDQPGASALFSGAWRGGCPKGLKRALDGAGYDIVECGKLLPHPNGSALEADYATPAHKAAELRENTLVCGITGVPAFHARGLASLWSERANIELLYSTITIDATPRAGWSPASLASAIETDPTILTRPLSMLRQQQRAKRVILPAVLGIDQHASLHKRIEEQTGCTVGEALGAPPSLPGWRLQNALARALANAGVQLLNGRARVRTQDARIVQDVSISDDVVHAAHFVLATGKFISGGIEATTEFTESVFGLPIWVDHLDEPFHAPEPLILTHPERTDEQPLMGAGVHADAEGRPVDVRGDVVYENVRVAGSVRAGWTVAHSAGDCAEDGWRAGERAAKR